MQKRCVISVGHTGAQGLVVRGCGLHSPRSLERTRRDMMQAKPRARGGASQVKFPLPKFHKADSALRLQAAGGVGACRGGAARASLGL